MKRRSKRVLLLSICIGLLVISFFTENSVFAQFELIPGLSNNRTRAEYDLGAMQKFAESAENGLKTLYLIMWPMLALAGAAMDNSLVYGEAFYLTSALFKFWQIIRTFANFALGFYFLRKILSAFFNNKLEGTYFELIKKIFMAGVLINFSWYIVAGLIDISTVATVSLGGIPIHALQKDEVFKNNIYYLKTHANMNLNDSKAEKADRFDFSLIYSCYPSESSTGGQTTGGAGNIQYYLPCAINDQKLYEKGDQKEPLTREKYKQDYINVWKADTKIDTTKFEDAFCVMSNRLIANNYGKNIGSCKELQSLLVQGTKHGITQCAQINDLITRSRNYTGPIFAMYTSIINVADMGVTTSSGSLKQVGLTLMIKVVTLLALIVPLIAFAVVMIIRVIYLWMIIIFSPLIALVMMLERGESVQGKVDGALKNMFNIGEVVKLILLPAIATFALSISIIFLTLLHNLPMLEKDLGPAEKAITTTDGCRNDTITALGYDRVDTTGGTMYDFGTFQINIAEATRRTGADIGNILSWIGLNGLGIALMWMVVFAALKSSEFTKEIVQTIEDTAKSVAGTVPFIPIGDNKMIGLNTLGEAPGRIKDEIKNRAQTQQNDIINDAFAKNFSGETRDLQNQFTQAATTDTGVGHGINQGINTTPIKAGTDFRDYSDAGKTYAKQAQAYFDKTPDPENPGKKLGENESIRNSLAGINSMQDALSNPHFAKWMADDPANKTNGTNGYDSFLPNRDKRSSKDEQTTNAVEEGMKKIGKAITNTKNNTIKAYQWDNNSKITLFERNPKTGRLVGDKTQTRKIDAEKIDRTNITRDEIEAFNTLMKKGFDLPDLPLFKTFAEKRDITVNGKTVKPIINNGVFEGYELPKETTSPSTSETEK